MDAAGAVSGAFSRRRPPGPGRAQGVSERLCGSPHLLPVPVPV